MSKLIEVDLHSKFNKDTEVELKMNLASLIQLFNAVNFVANHKVEFLNYIDGLIESAEKHYREEHLN